jgi:hypothetical protein
VRRSSGSTLAAAANAPIKATDATTDRIIVASCCQGLPVRDVPDPDCVQEDNPNR